METKITKRARIFALLAGFVLMSAGCGGGNPVSNKPVTLTFWNTFEDSGNLDTLFNEYRAKHPNVTIQYVKKNIDTYESDLLDALASGSGPDIFSINNAWLPKYLDKVSPAPDNVFILKDYKDTFVDVATQDFTKNNKIYGVPLTVDSLALYYNKDLLGTVGIATPPKTWDELAQDVRRIKRQDRTGYFTRSGVALGTNANINRAPDILYLFMLQQGVMPYAQDFSSPTFAQSVEKNGNIINPSQQALDFYTSFALPIRPNYNWNARSDYSIDAFVNGRAAFLYSYSYTRQTILQKSPNLNFDVASVPQPNLDDPSVNFANYFGEVVSKQSKNSAVAWDFLKFMSSKATLDKYYAKHKQPSSRKDLVDLQISDPEIGVFANANLTAKAFYRPDQVKFDNIFGTLIDNVILKGLTTNEALNQAQQQAASIMQP